MEGRTRRLAIAIFSVMLGVGLLIGIGLGVWVARRMGPATEDAATAVTTTSASTPAEPAGPAASAFAEAMEAQRGADPVAMHAALDRAIKLDPTYARAHLHLGLNRLTSSAKGARPHFSLAERHAAALDAHERELLRALAPCVASESGALGPCMGPLRALLSGAFATDPFLHAFAGWLLLRTGEPGDGLVIATRGLDLDPRFAFGWLTRGTLEAFLGRFDDALASFEACSKQAPGSTACLRAKTYLYSHLGEPGACERTARLLIERSPADPVGALLLADALAANRRPPAELRAAIDRAVELTAEAARPSTRARLEAGLAARRGDLRAAVAKYEVALGASSNVADAKRYRTTLWPLLELLHEIDEDDRAADIAEQLEKRLGAEGADARRDPFSPLLDPLPMIVQARTRAQRLDEDGRRAALEAFLSAAPPPPRALAPAAWLSAWGATADTQKQAEDAFARLRAEHGGLPSYAAGVPRLAGRPLRLAGRLDEAIAELEPASRSCLALTAPTADVVASYELGLALEAKRDEPGACAAYRSVLDLWGNAKPPPSIARKAKKAAARSAARESTGRPPQRVDVASRTVFALRVAA